MTLKTRNTLIGLGAAATAVAVIYVLRAVFIPLFIAFFAAYAFNPLINRISRQTRRTPAIVIIIVVVAAAATLLLMYLIPMFMDIVATFVRSVPELLGRLREMAAPFFKERFGLEIPATLEEISERVMEGIGGVGAGEVKTAGAVFKWAFSGTMNVISFAMMLILIPFFSFYFMRDYSRVLEWFKGMIPPRHAAFIGGLFGEIDDVLSHFIRGQLAVCVVMGSLYAVSLKIWGVEKGIAIGMITGILNIIPYAGLATGLVLSLSLSLLTFHGWLPVVGCLVTYTALPLVDNFFVTPRILGKSVGMNPVIIIVSLLVGGQLLGLVGLLIAVPAAAVIRVIGRQAIESYRRSILYQGEPPPGDAPGK